jgi:glyoxylase-like metal-dependent hydrolase (beta-lactamase superfamily II)
MKTRRLITTSILFLFLSLKLFGQKQTPALKISHLTGDFYIYTTYKSIDGNPFPSNSMYLVTNAGVVMFDTPWDSREFQPLLDSIERRHKKKVVICISTHFHSDRTAGLDYLKQQGVKTYSSKQTYELCKERNEKQAEFTFNADTTFTVGDHSFQTFYPGEGHSEDNIVIWSEKSKVLYGGCLIKSTENADLGNLADANLAAWEISIQKVINKYPSYKYVIPGHLGWANNQSLTHTFNLLKKNQGK